MTKTMSVHTRTHTHKHIQQINLLVLTNQAVHQVFHLVRLTARHNKLLQMLEVFGLQQCLVLSILADES